MSVSAWIIVGLVLYACFMTYHGMSMFKATSKSQETFFTADRGVSPFVLLCTTIISIFSGLSYYGIPAAIYRNGIGYFAATGGCVAGLLFVVLGYRLWLLGREYGFVTPSDYLRARYYSESYGVFVSIVMLVFIIPYVALQIITIGNGIVTTTHGLMPYLIAVAFGTVVISLHIIGGGMKSVAWMDTFHFLLALVALLSLFIYLVVKYFPAGGLVQAIQIMQSDPQSAKLLSHPGPNGIYNWKGTLSLAMTGAVATVVWPHIFTRAYIAKSKDNFRFLAWAMPLAYLVAFSILAIIGGILAPAILGPGIKNSDMIVAILSTEYAPPIISFLSILCLLAFAVSTADSFLLTASAIASRDLFVRHKYELKGLAVEPKEVVKFGRIILLVLLFLTLWIVSAKPIYIVDYAYKLSSPGFAMILPATVGGLFWRRGTKEGAWAGTLCGLLVVIYFTFFAKPPFGFSNLIWGLVVNIILYVGVSLASPTVPKDVVSKYFDRVESIINSGSETHEAIDQAIIASNNKA